MIISIGSVTVGNDKLHRENERKKDRDGETERNIEKEMLDNTCNDVIRGGDEKREWIREGLEKKRDR